MSQAVLEDRRTRPDRPGNDATSTPWAMSASVTLKSEASNVCDNARDAKLAKMKGRIATELTCGRMLRRFVHVAMKGLKFIENLSTSKSCTPEIDASLEVLSCGGFLQAERLLQEWFGTAEAWLGACCICTCMGISIARPPTGHYPRLNFPIATSLASCWVEA